MADRNTNMQYEKSNKDFYTEDENGKRISWGRLLREYGCGAFAVVKIFNPTSGSGHCYSKGGPAEWLTVIDNEVVGSEPTRRRAFLIGNAIIGGHIEKTGDTGARLDGYLIGMAVWNYDGPAPTEKQQREINALLK